MAGFKAVPSFSIATPNAFMIVVSINGFTSDVSSDSWRNESSQGFTMPDLVGHQEQRGISVLLDIQPSLEHSGLSSAPLPHPCHIGPLTKLTVLSPPRNLMELKNCTTSSSNS